MIVSIRLLRIVDGTRDRVASLMESSHVEVEPPTFKPHRALGLLAIALLLLCVWVARDFVGTLVLASWLVTTFYRLFVKLSAKTKDWVAALVFTSGILIVIVAPLIAVMVVLVTRTTELARQGLELWHRGDLVSTAAALLGQPEGGLTSLKLEDLKLENYYEKLASATPGMLAGVGKVFQIASEAVVKMFLFVLFVYGLFANGRRAKAWMASVSPFDPRATAELMATYAETGRGILVGVFLIVIIHGVLSTTGYALVGVPHAFELGGLTALAGIVPGLGTGLVWAPLALVLALTGHAGQAGLVLLVGLVVGSADNLLRPWLSRLGEVPLPTLPLFVAFFGGIAVFGASGLLLGPLLFALTKRAFELHAAPRSATPATLGSASGTSPAASQARSSG